MAPPARLDVSRRSLLAAVALAAAGCAKPSPASAPAPKVDTPPPFHIGALTDLLPLAHLRWVVQAKPREIAAIPWLIPALGIVAPEPNLDRFKATTGLDLRQIPEAAIATYADEGGASTLYLVRHTGDPKAVERLFRARLTGGEHRAVDRPDLVRVWGKIGQTPAALVVLGNDVMGFQFGGNLTRGPARIAGLYATDKLRRSPTLFAGAPLRALSTRIGEAPVRAFAVGPFEGDLAQGARGLLARATAVAATARPSGREGILAVIAVAGDFATTAEPASRALVRAWTELADSSFGHLMGIDRPLQAPLPTHGPEAVSVMVEVDPEKLAKGIAAATSDRIDEIMR